MARKNLLQFVQQTDPNVNQLQINLRDALETISSDADVYGIPGMVMTATGGIPAGQSIVMFNGRSGQTLGLPGVKAQGQGISIFLLIGNLSTNSVKVTPSGNDKIGGALSLTIAAGGLVAFVGDANANWLALASSSGGGITQLTGPVTAGPGSGSQASSVTANALTNAMLAQMPTLTVKGNNTGGTANALDLTVAQMQAMITYPGRLRSFQILTSGTTYTRPAGITSVLVEGWAGGGGGGGSVIGTAANAGMGGGGGSGGYFRKWYLVAPASGTYAIGAAGVAGANTGAVAGNGGNTTFTDGTTLCTANGGAGAPAQVAVAATAAIGLGGAGGAISTNGDVNQGGQPGGMGFRMNGTTGIAGGAGAAGFLAGGGVPRVTQGAGNNAIANSGAGGGGAAAIGAVAAVAGGTGGAGLIAVWEFA